KKMAKLRLKKAQVLLKQKLYSAFYEELHKAILGYLSDKLAIKMADLNRENVEDILLTQGVEKKVIDDLNALLDACEFARYAPASGYTAMENHYNQAINIISEIES
ncbi:MAG: protein BatD, partial [Bacteroidales bacterium]